jgi:chromosome partitioning protein
MTAITLASALAARGGAVAVADADPQKSALRWLRHRPADVPAITGLDWTKAGHVGDLPGSYDWLVVDAPGAIKDGRAEALIGESDSVIAPVLPSVFDEDSTRRFLRDIEDIKRIRKGKVGLHLVANRVRPQQRATVRLQAFFAGIGHEPLAWITERAAYAELAEQGLAIFDRPQRVLAPIRAQWEPVVAAVA